MQITKKELREYYSKCVLWLPEKPAQRQFKLVTWEGRFMKLRRRIGTKQALRKVLLRYAPTSVWYSAGRFLSPENVGSIEISTAGYITADSTIVGCDLPFDIDGDFSIQGLEDARKRTISVINTIKNKLKYILFTGNKGFQVVYEGKDYIHPNPKLRDASIRLERKQKTYIVDVLNKHINRVDRDVSLNSRTIIRLPNTARQNGFVATLLTLKEVQMNIQYLIPKFGHVTPTSPVIPLKGKMKQKESERLLPRRYKNMGVESLGQAPPPTILAVSNEIGTRSVILLKYQERQNYMKDLTKLQKKFCFGPTIVLRRGETIYAVGVVALDKERATRIYKASKSLNKSGYLKYGKAYLRMPVDPKFKIETIALLNGSVPKGSPVSSVFEKFLKYKVQEEVDRITKPMEVRKAKTGGNNEKMF